MDVIKMKDYYIRGLWTIGRVEKLLKAGRISQQEYDQITGNSIEEKDNQL